MSDPSEGRMLKVLSLGEKIPRCEFNADDPDFDDKVANPANYYDAVVVESENGEHLYAVVDYRFYTPVVGQKCYVHPFIDR
jgi:hypothetical protein